MGSEDSGIQIEEDEMRPEETIEKKFVEEVEKLGYKSHKFEIVGTKGPPDQIVFLPGACTMFFEFKAPGELCNTSRHQDKFIAYLKNLGFRVHIVDTWEYPLSIVKAYAEVYE